MEAARAHKKEARGGIEATQGHQRPKLSDSRKPESRGCSVKENRKEGKNVRESKAGSKSFQRTEMQGEQDKVTAS